ncbi:VOC family protein [Candidatus Woesebacteria bacterium]|nr:VOC family protein [Candidatus Woesebacteria bacterium]
MNSGVAWIILITDNYLASRSFYADTLSFPVEREVTADEFCQFLLPNCRLAIYGRAHAQKLLTTQRLGAAGGAIYSFPESENIDLDYQNLLTKGVHFIAQPNTQPWGQRTAYFTDPDGHIWELQQWMS